MWRKGWQITGVWMAAYAFLCYFPRLVLLVPHAILLGILLATYPSEQLSSTNDRGATPTPPSNAGEGTVDWQANIQAIQNLMGAVADLHDLILPFVPHLTHATPYTPLILTFLLATFLFAIPLLPLIPLRPTFLVLGLGPFIFTHPFMMYRVLPLIVSLLHDKSHRARVLRIIDDDRLEDRHWRSELKEVELFENERWNASSDGEAVSGSWGKSYLKSSERSAWTRAQDGWSGVKEDGSGEVSSNLTFSLAPGWAFIETEDWRVDLEATWVANVGPDDGGWVYTNDSWLNPSAVPLDTWKSVGMTRRRRWTRRIYYDPAIAT
ncbi:hypothetical protein SERLADRAFT_479565 [Serpula lacrymans var. lacrymans S7.9]|nr:uncharacterized protein SERLADRAFT_479565 [Serpula lacrymans var. lacrymans S7.9]EGO19202.1 hypothetical protein SERLADRAFT_479565 [Serpula lacrymans var. lacrymans S7.9]